MRHPRPWRRTGLGLLLLAMLAACAVPPAPAPTPEAAALAPTAATQPLAPTTPAGPVAITFGTYESARAVYEPLVAEFNAANPDVQVQIVSLDTLMRGGDLNIPWEQRLAATSDTFATWSIDPTAVERGFVRDLAPFVAADPGLNAGDFYPGAIQSDAAGRVGMLPATLMLPLLMYNRDLWDERGLPRPTPDWAWADLRAAAEQLARRDGDTIETYGLMLATRSDLVGTVSLHSLGPLLEGVDPRTVNLDSPQFEGALEELAQLVRDGVVYTSPEYSDGSFLNTADYMPLITGGKIGMWMSDYYLPMGDDAPQFATGYAVLPLAPERWYLVNRQGFAMSAGTQHPDAAWRWLAFLSTKDTAAAVSRGAEAIPARRSLNEASTAWNELDEESRAAFTAALDQLAADQAIDRRRYSEDFWRIPTALANALKAVLDENESPQAALAAAQTTMAEDLSAAVAATPTPAATAAPIVVATARPVVAAAPEAARITFVSTEYGDTALRDLAAQFNEQFPQYFVEVQPFEWPNSSDPVALRDIIATGDCMRSFGGTPEPEDRAALLDLRPLIDADQGFARDDVPQALLEPFEHEGRLYGLPHSVTLRGIHYNKELFDAASLAYPDADWTVDDFMAAAERLKTAGGGEGTYGFVPQSGWDMFLFFDLLGVPLVQGSGDAARPDFGSAALREAIGRYFALLRAAAPEATGLADYSRDNRGAEGFQLTSDGRAAMWFAYGFDDNISPGPEPFARGIAPLPLSDEGRRHAELFTNGLYIAADSASPAACWAFMRFLLDAPTGYGVAFPARVSIAEAPAFLGSAPEGAAELYAAMKPALLDPPVATGSLALFRAGGGSYWLQRAAERAFRGGDLDRELTDAQFFAEQYQACVRSGEQHDTCARQVDPSYDGW